MRYSLLFLIFSLVVNVDVNAWCYYPQYTHSTECPEYSDEDGSYEEVVQTPKRRNLLRGHYYDEQDPTDELEHDTAWPSRNEEFSDQLFNPKGGPW